MRNLCLVSLLFSCAGMTAAAANDRPDEMAGDLPSRVSLWDTKSQADTRLVAAETAVAPDVRTLDLGWQVALKGRWKTYWRAPGDAGLPPEWDWSGSTNVASVKVGWPTPERLTVFGLESYVYTREVVLPLSVRLKNPGKAADLRLKVAYMVCEQICVPLEATYRLFVPAGEALPTAEAGLIQQYVTLIPNHKGDVAVAGAVYDTNCGQSRMMLKLAAALPKGRKSDAQLLDAFVDGPEGVTFGRPLLSSDRRQIMMPVRGLDADDRRLSEALHLVVRPPNGKPVAWDGVPARAPRQQTCARAGT